MSAPVAHLDEALPAAAEAPAPRSKGLEDSAIWRWLTGGNTVVRVGVVVLFFGVAFLLRYAYEHVHAPIELRLAGVTAGAIALLAFGWRLRERRAGYALALQGGGIGVLYLVIFAAFKLYNLIPPAPAFALLVGVAAFSAVVAVHPGLALARGARRLGRLPRADPRVDRRRQPRDALQLLRGAERRHPRASPGSRRGGS